jgi:hypothetical protein
MSQYFNYTLGTLSFLIISGILCFNQYSPIARPNIDALAESRNLSDYYFPFIKAKDTIHLLGNEYLEIRLQEQKTYLIRRADTSIVYRISTGNAAIEKGLSTPAGFFTVQSKSPIAISKQFENAELYNWIGFNGNIGFHGLKKTGYYASLGIRPSSHGCVRIGKESGLDLYKRVRLGTPVIVYQNKPALEMVFSTIREFDPSEDILLNNYPMANRKLFARRLNNISNGLALRYNNGRLFLDGRTILKPGGYVIGSDSSLPNKQKKPLVKGNFFVTNRDNLKIRTFKPQLPDSSKSKQKNLNK